MDVESVVGELNDRLRFSHGRLQETKLELVKIKTEAAKKLQYAEAKIETLKGELEFVKGEFGQRVVDIGELRDDIRKRSNNENQLQQKVAEKEAEIQAVKQQAVEKDAHILALTQHATWLRDEVQRRGNRISEHEEKVKQLTYQASKSDLEASKTREHMAHRYKVEGQKRRMLEGNLDAAQTEVARLKEQRLCLESTSKANHENLVAENERLKQTVSELRFRLASRPLSKLPERTARVPISVSEVKIDTAQEDNGKTCHIEAEHDEVVRRAQGENKNVDALYGKDVPALVVRAFQELVSQPDGHISVEEINATILAVDLIYQRSMRKRVAQLRARHAEEIDKIQQKIKERAPYTQTICADKIRYLKKQLADAQRRRGAVQGEGGKMMRVLLDKALCMAVEYDRLKNQNTTLQAALDEDGCRIRMQHAFCRGTMWLSRKILGALQWGEDRILEALDLKPPNSEGPKSLEGSMKTLVRTVHANTLNVFRDLHDQVTALPTPADVRWIEG